MIITLFWLNGNNCPIDIDLMKLFKMKRVDYAYPKVKITSRRFEFTLLDQHWLTNDILIIFLHPCHYYVQHYHHYYDY